MDATKRSSIRSRGLVLAVAAVAVGGPAAAQSMFANSASFNAGYGRAPGQENRPVDFGTRDANGNQVIIDGIIQTGSDQSAFSAGAANAFAGAGAGLGLGGATAIGNNLSVITQGDNNIVIIDSRQTNNGDVTATSSATTSGVGDGH